MMKLEKKITRRYRESGFILITSLIILVLLTALAIGMFHSFTEQEGITANSKEKSRAFEIAQSTLQYAEYQLVQLGSTLPRNTTCNAAVSITQVCTTYPNGVNISPPTSTNSVMTLANGSIYTNFQPNFTISHSGGVTNGIADYYDKPQYYIQFLGLSSNGELQLYQVTALGYGGNANAVAVVQSTYQLTSSTKNLGSL